MSLSDSCLLFGHDDPISLDGPAGLQIFSAPRKAGSAGGLSVAVGPVPEGPALTLIPEELGTGLSSLLAHSCSSATFSAVGASLDGCLDILKKHHFE